MVIRVSTTKNYVYPRTYKKENAKNKYRIENSLERHQENTPNQSHNRRTSNLTIELEI